MITQAMPDKLRLAVQLGAWCAMRYGEVFELRRKDLDLWRGWLTCAGRSFGLEGW